MRLPFFGLGRARQAPVYLDFTLNPYEKVQAKDKMPQFQKTLLDATELLKTYGPQAFYRAEPGLDPTLWKRKKKKAKKKTHIVWHCSYYYYSYYNYFLIIVRTLCANLFGLFLIQI